MSKLVTNQSLAREYAGQFGLVVGLLWLTSFVCSMYSLDKPLLGHLGNFAAILSVLLEVRFIRRFQLRMGRLNGVRRWLMGLMTNTNAALITTMGQYIYFRFLDKGHMVTSITNALSNTEYQQMVKQMMPGMDADNMLAMISSMTLSDMLVSVITINVILAFVLSLLLLPFTQVRQQSDTPADFTPDNTTNKE